MVGSEQPAAVANWVPVCSALASGVEMQLPLSIAARANSPRAGGEVSSEQIE